MGLSRDGSKGAGDWCAPEPVDSKKHRYACNEIKLPAKLARPRVTDTLAPHDVRRRGQSNEENRYMAKSHMIGTEGEITALYRDGVRDAEI